MAHVVARRGPAPVPQRPAVTQAQPFEAIVAEHGRSVMGVCRALLGGSGDAEDAWSDTFLAAMRAYPRLRPGSNIRGWLVTIAHHKAIDVIRARTRHAEPSGDLPEAHAPDPPPPEPDGALRAAVDGLPTKQRAAVIYRYLADLSYAEIGELLECSEAAARRNASDGIAKLRQRYQKGSPA